MKDFFSSLKRVKTYLLTPMCDEKLIDLMIIAVEKRRSK